MQYDSMDIDHIRKGVQHDATFQQGFRRTRQDIYSALNLDFMSRPTSLPMTPLRKIEIAIFG